MDPIRLPALPPADAVAYFAAKGTRLVPSFAWQDLYQEDHAAAFTVAKSAGFDILKDIHAAQAAAIAEGTGFETFRDRLTPILQDAGWWGRKLVEDPATGDLVSAQLGSVRRLRTIYDTNLRMAYAAGNWAGFTRTAASRPYLRYTAILDSHTRPAHRAWHGTILPIGDPWFDTHSPPCGWFCRCRLISVSEADLKRYGWRVSDGPPPDPQPPQLYTNPRTGQVTAVPYGIDPGFAYNPGRAAIEVHAAQVAAFKWTDAAPGLTAAQQAASIRFLRPSLVRDFGGWVDEVYAEDYRMVGDLRVIGALDQDVLDDLGRRGIEPQSGAITVTDKILGHFRRDAKVARGNALDLADVKRLPDFISDPDAVYYDADDPAVIYVFDAPDTQSGKIVVRIDFADKLARKTVITNSVRTGETVEASQLGHARYKMIKHKA